MFSAHQYPFKLSCMLHSIHKVTTVIRSMSRQKSGNRGVYMRIILHPSSPRKCRRVYCTSSCVNPCETQH